MRRKAAILILLAALAAAPLAALEVTTLFNIGNMGFSETPMDPVASTDYASDAYSWGLGFIASQNLGTGLGIDFSYTGDPILSHLVKGTFTYNGEFFSIGAGPAFGIFNTRETPLQPGISTNFRIEWPGIIFLKFDLFSSIGYQLRNTGDYSQGNSTLSFGFYVPNAICTLNMETKNLTEITASHGERNDSLTEYSFKTQIYQKNVPFRVLVGLLYRTTETAFSHQVIEGPDIANLETVTYTLSETLNSLLLQTRLDMAFSPAVSLFLDVYSSIFSFGSIKDTEASTIDTLVIPDSFPGGYLFEATLGVKINFDNFKD